MTHSVGVNSFFRIPLTDWIERFVTDAIEERLGERSSSIFCMSVMLMPFG